MFRLCWEKYIIDKKFNGYYLWERVAPFKYIERLSGVSSLVDFFIDDDVYDFDEHIISKKQLSFDKYKANHRSHVDRSIEYATTEKLKYSYGTFETFISEFTKKQLGDGWIRKNEYPESFFTDSQETQVHANLILFNGIYMILKNYKDYYKFKEFLKENGLKLEKPERVDKWSTLV
jgi:hypothetical protein